MYLELHFAIPSKNPRLQ